MKNIRLRSFFYPLVLSIGLYLGYAYFGATDQYSLREIHHNLYDLYLPDNHSLSVAQRLKRLFYREAIWWKIRNNPDISQMLDPINNLKDKLSPEVLTQFEDIRKHGFRGVSSDRQEEFRRTITQTASPELRKYLFTLRQTWLYIVYSSPLTNEIAGIEPKPEAPIFNIDLNLPQTKLVINDNEISHYDGEIDYLIVGSGPAGSVISHELARNKPGTRVLLIESGPFVKPLSIITELSPELMESNNNRRTNTGGIVIRNGATVGGGTTVNLDLAFSPMLPQIRLKLDQWIKEDRLPSNLIHVTGKDWKKLESAYDWVSEKVMTRHVSEDEINKNNKLLKDGDPLSKTYDLNSRKFNLYNQKGHIQHNLIPKISAAEAFIVPALKGGKNFLGHLSLISDAKVTEIHFEKINNNKIATGVTLLFNDTLDRKFVAKDINEFGRVVGKKFKIKAKNIILCAGTLGSAEILLRSNVSNANIGKGITIHPSMGVIGLFEHEINVLNGLSASVYAPSPDGGYFFEAMSADPKFIALVHPGSGTDIIRTLQNYKKLGGFGIMLVDTASNDNQVYIDPETNLIQIKYLISGSDKLRMKDALKEAVKILFNQGAREVFIPTAENIFESGKFSPFTSPEETDAIIEKLKLIDALNFISSAHMQGSNKLGQDPKTSVVSPEFKVWDTNTNSEIDNLYVCDSSVFPTSVGANPMQSIYTIAKLFVDTLYNKPN